MYQLEFPLAALALPLPLLIWLLLPVYRETMPAVRVPLFEQMATLAHARPLAGAVVMRANWLQVVLAPLCWGLLVLAMMRPVYVEPPVERIEAGRDLLLAIDLSQSMEARDYVNAQGQRLNRLQAAKQVIAPFIDRRRDDRIGLIAFGATAFPQAPLTLDHDSVKQLLDELQIGMAGPQTAIGDAIGVGIRMTEKSKAKEKVLILLTDGGDTASKLPPERAAGIARDKGLIIHTIGIGDPNATGEDKVDLAALQKIAAVTGGQFYRGENLRGLEQIYTTLDRITPDKVKRQSHRPKRELFYLPLMLAGALIVFYHALMLFITLIRRPRRRPLTA
ncbi:Ca-activated chloride channel family protein [Silvimonas terrae]|uniref:Ca-activated chloride channel family protein n=1 Tax=Silvimonas terrae TaxID=300266 RepID=A0A840RE82_9NEIS|nr:VWA domain-containing protein [Silvimonas terrae]MBB5190736.1 Ca-activated chloride channel family protein [Silvimonas terrae]